MILDEKFWLAVCFIIFVTLAYRPIKKALLGLIDRRIELIKDQLKRAEVMHMEAKTSFQKSQKQLEQTISERDDLLKTAKEDLDKISKESKQELEMLLKRKERDAESRLEQLKEKATGDLRKTFIETARELTELYLNERKTELPKDEVLASRLLKK